MQQVVDLPACIASVSRQWEDTGFRHPVKLSEDLDRYKAIIDRTEPDLLIETGTYIGESADWFARVGIDVVTIDIGSLPEHTDPRVTHLAGSSTDLAVYATVERLAAGRRTMVSLDSDHTAEHVREEIDLYHRLVSPGCYLVVEDGICRWTDSGSSPLDAIESTLAHWPEWQRDIDIEALHPVTMHIGGWWKRCTTL